MFELVLWTCLSAAECGKEQLIMATKDEDQCRRVVEIYSAVLGPDADPATYHFDCRPVGNVVEVASHAE